MYAALQDMTRDRDRLRADLERLESKMNVDLEAAMARVRSQLEEKYNSILEKQRHESKSILLHEWINKSLTTVSQHLFTTLGS